VSEPPVPPASTPLAAPLTNLALKSGVGAVPLHKLNPEGTFAINPTQINMPPAGIVVAESFFINLTS
jgi:hypothetical protein